MDTQFTSTYEILPCAPEQYLQRIGAQLPDGGLTLSYLDDLVLLHQCAIPFENLEIIDQHRPISTNIRDICHKVLDKKRGGYCFELNALFCALLCALGYDAFPCACRIQRGAEEPRPVMHRATLVRWEGQLYFCDVGYGGSMYPGALLITPGTVQRKEDATFHWEEGNGFWWQLVYHTRSLTGEDGRAIPSQQRLEMLVCTAPSAPVDFDLPNQYCCSHPDSFFVNHRAVYLRRDGGQVALMDRQLSKVENGRRVCRLLESEEEVRQVLKDTFGLVITE